MQRFLPGETLKCFEFEALKDFTLEETFEDYFLPLSVSSQSTVTVSGPASIRVTILDRDCEYIPSLTYKMHVCLA